MLYTVDDNGRTHVGGESQLPLQRAVNQSRDLHLCYDKTDNARGIPVKFKQTPAV